jgi:hypothetical protein
VHKHNSSCMFTLICLSRKLYGLWKKWLAIKCSNLYFTLQLLVWHSLLTEYLIRHATICVGNICTVSFKACCCCWCHHLVLNKNFRDFSEMLLIIIKVHMGRWMCTWRDIKKWRRYNVHYCKCLMWMHQ